MSFARQIWQLTLNRALGAGLAFLISILSARLLTPREFGTVAAMIATLALVMRLLSLGMGQSAQYFGAKTDEPAERKNIIFNIAIVVSLFSAAVIIIFGDGLRAILMIDDKVGYNVWQILQFSIPLSLFHFIISLFFLGRKMLKEYLFLSISPLYVTVAALLAALWLHGGIKWVAWSWLAQYAMGALVALWMMRIVPFRPPFTERLTKDFFRYGLQSYATFVAAFAVGQVAVLSGFWFGAATNVGTYAVAQSYGNALGLIFGAVGPLVFSHASAMSSSDDQRAFIGRVCRVMAIFCVLAAVPIGAFADFAIPRLFGVKYSASATVIWFLLPGLCFSALQKVLENYLYSRDRQLGLVIVHIVTISSILVLTLCLSPRYGAVGLAMAASAGFFVALISTTILVRIVDGLGFRALWKPTVEDFRTIRRMAPLLLGR